MRCHPDPKIDQSRHHHASSCNPTSAPVVPPRSGNPLMKQPRKPSNQLLKPSEQEENRIDEGEEIEIDGSKEKAREDERWDFDFDPIRSATQLP